MINIESCNLKNGCFDDPTCVIAQNEAPVEILLRSVLTAQKTQLNYTRPIKGAIFATLEAATAKLEPHRDAGVGFTLTRIPILIANYPNLSIGIRCEKKLNGTAYERLLLKCKDAWPEFWQTLPRADKEWILCFPIRKTPLSDFKGYEQESFKGYFLGTNFPIQWDRIPYLFARDYFVEFLKFHDRLKVNCVSPSGGW